MALSGILLNKKAALLGFKNGLILFLAMLRRAHLDNWQCRMELIRQRVLEAAILLVPSGTLKTQTCVGSRGDVSCCSLSQKGCTYFGVQQLTLAVLMGLRAFCREQL